jgi:hypothetical protein
MYATKYILSFNNDLNERYDIYFDFLNYVGATTQLAGTDDVLTIRCTAGDENKMEPILGKEALINISVEVDTPISIADLIAAHDNDIRVTVYRDQDFTKVDFQGFIVVEDNSQPFLDPPFTLSIRALDGLGLLKGVDLADTNNLLFVGNQSILSWIAQILYKTDQTLNLRVYFNFYESSFNQMLGALEQVYLNAITFSQGDAFNSTPLDPSVDINSTSADDCYTALEKIVRCLRCRLFQEDGVWNLVSLFEYLNPAGFSYKEYAFGAPVNGIVPVSAFGTADNRDYTAVIGKNQAIHPVTEDQVYYLKIATKWIKLTYTYDQSQNKVCNQDFSEGDRNATYDAVINSSILDPSIQPPIDLTTQGYDLYCWGHFNGTNVDVFQNPFPQNAPDKKAYIRSVLDSLDYEKERYVVLENTLTVSYIQSSPFYLDVSDALAITLDVRTKNNHSGIPGLGEIYVLLTADDGTFWALNGAEGPGITDPESNKATWIQTNSQFRNSASSFEGTPSVGYEGVSGSGTISWTNISAGGYKPAITPVSGTVIILIGNRSAYNDEFWYKNLQVTITPYLHGSYKALKGDYNFSSSALNIKQTEADDVEISDSPKRYFKGALLRANADLCTPTWSRKGVSESFRFAQLMERIMVNHLCQMLAKLEGTWRGLVYVPADDNTVVRSNGFLNSYMFEDGPAPTKRFMCTSFEKDYGTGQWRGVFVETLIDRNDTGFLLPDTFKFSYIFQ